jgi:predicted AlkP superfamily pyrophosphatase or phosphodiesterase
MGLTTPFVILLLLSLRLFVFASDSDDNQRHNLIILLIDGYGASLFNRTDPKLQDAALELIKNGVKAELKPVFPTQSYPNWYSLATGMF